MVWCDTCRKQVQACGWCRGAGVRSVGGKPEPCTGCNGTGKFCKHTGHFTADEQEALEYLQARYKRGWIGPGNDEPTPGGVS